MQLPSSSVGVSSVANMMGAIQAIVGLALMPFLLFIDALGCISL